MTDPFRVPLIIRGQIIDDADIDYVYEAVRVKVGHGAGSENLISGDDLVAGRVPGADAEMVGRVTRQAEELDRMRRYQIRVFGSIRTIRCRRAVFDPGTCVPVRIPGNNSRVDGPGNGNIA